MKKTGAYFIKTFGCVANVADSERISTALEKKGYRLAKTVKKADLVVINSCHVRESAENRVYGLVKNYRMVNDKCQIMLTGCLAGWALRDKTGKNLKILKRKTKDQVKIILFEDLADFKVEPKRLAKTAHIPISNGCDHFCSYCVVPYARGREKYLSARQIIDQVNRAIKQGTTNIVLLGQNVNSWEGRGEIKTFPQLLDQVAKIDKKIPVGFLSANPWNFSDQLIKVISENQNIPREIHLPVQSGDDQILKKMNRGYTAKQYLQLIERIKRSVPEATFTTDILIGFPGETKKAFQNTIKLCKAIGFNLAFLNKYSPRPGTVSSKKYPDNVPPAEKKRRWRVLEKLINQREA